MKIRLLPWIPICCLLVVSSSLAGCSGTGAQLPDLVEVTGTVSLDGEPLEKAQVTFEPQKASEEGWGRSSSAYTDAAGHFILQYKQNISGATPGLHHVIISKREGDDPATSPEVLPVQYNESTTLTADVTQAGPNEFTFDLTSK
ncbi:MAG: carboxypeptidase regulatory-like domain-containing protein [Planctomycetaceae bacterium]|nr:carboxypeptidase regulatory-like domain-containing protein [Planctomycetaceae bacterium]